MTAPALATERPSAPLGFVRTLDRTLVHRWALSEVFLTDFRPAPTEEQPLRHLAAAQLPTSHAYFTDHLAPAGAVDPVLLLECARQAATCLAHEALGVPRDSAFLVSEWALELPGPTGPTAGARPGELRIVLDVARHLARGGTTRGAVFRIALELDGTAIGTVDIAARYTPAEEAAVLRRQLRRSDPPRSDLLPTRVSPTVAEPASVRRGSAVNCALDEVVPGPGRACARVSVPGNHPTHFDHPQDHFTAMTLIEAARQAAWLALADAQLPFAARTSAFRARFLRFAELDSPVSVEAAALPAREPDGAPRAVARRTAAVVFRQDGQVLSEIEVDVAWPSAPATASVEETS